MPSFRIGFLAFPNMTQLDMTGPLQVFAYLPEAETRVIWKTRDPIATQGGLRLVPDTVMSDCPQLDVICIPGGSGVLALMEDAEVLDFIRQQAAEARYVGSICTGSLVLGAAGLLKGKKATTHWAWIDLLATLGAIPTKDRVVRDGNVFTGGGVTAGIDFGLTMVAELAGRDVAEGVQLGIEYAPSPPFNSGRPELARPEILTAVRERLDAMREQRETVAARVAQGLA